jgi:hypothetical protein
MLLPNVASETLLKMGLLFGGLPREIRSGSAPKFPVPPQASGIFRAKRITAAG